MSRLHPLWAPPSPTDIEVARNALVRAESLEAPSERERAYIDAIATYYRHAGTVSHVERLQRYETPLATLASHHPRDTEAQIFYALGLVSVAMVLPVDTTYERRRKAGAILEPLLAGQPDHPGLSHYIIHAYDVPALSPEAIRAARRYAAIAPASPHAQHMPSHIFTRRGLWPDAIASDTRAARVAQEFERRTGTFSQDYLHALDYLAFAYLQLERDTVAKRIVDEAARADTLKPGGHFASVYALAAIPARYALEQGNWNDASRLALRPSSDFLPAQAVARFARALGSARAKDTARARTEIQALTELRDQLARAGESQWARELDGNRLAVEAWIARAGMETALALRLADSAANLEDLTEKHPVMPGRILSARLLQGELLLDLGRPAEAARAFEAALAKEPGRARAIRGREDARRLSQAEEP